LSIEDPPDIGEEYIRLHKVMTRGLRVALENTDKYLQAGELEKVSEGFLKYIQGFSSVLHGHHLAEDEKIFPYFKDKLPDVPYERLTSEHEIFNEGLKEIKTGVDNLTSNTDELDSLKVLKSGLDKVDGLWSDHIQIENTQLYGKTRSLHIDSEEMIKIQKEDKEFFQDHSGPPYLVLPFVLYNLSPEDRAILTGEFHDNVTEHLINVDWKDKWISMQPFLLK
jgi:hemerythrin-like domain-containing protein